MVFNNLPSKKSLLRKSAFEIMDSNLDCWHQWGKKKAIILVMRQTTSKVSDSQIMTFNLFI